MGMFVRESVVPSLQGLANERFDADVIEYVVAAEKEFRLFDPSKKHPLELIADLMGIIPGNHQEIPKWNEWFRYLRTLRCSSDPAVTVHDKLRSVIFENISGNGAHLPMKFVWVGQGGDPGHHDITYGDSSESGTIYRVVRIASVAPLAAPRRAGPRAKARRKR